MKSGCASSSRDGGNLSWSRKSIEFSAGGFHLRLFRDVCKVNFCVNCGGGIISAERKEAHIFGSVPGV